MDSNDNPPALVKDRQARQREGVAALIALAQTTPRIEVLVPAHNEAVSIGRTLKSLLGQSRQPSRITVVCDNCTDGTEVISMLHGASVFTTTGNTDRKAGALNQALAGLLPQLSAGDLVLIVDADSYLNEGWLMSAVDVLARDRKVGAVCGTFFGDSGCGLVGQLQRNEYIRYARIIQRRFQALVLSGTATLFRVPVLREVARERGRTLPGHQREYYNRASITEDDEITLAIKTLGWKCLSPSPCETTTEVMPTWQALYRQRMRWQTGTLRDLRAYGMTRVTRWYWLRQAGLYGSFTVSLACLGIMGRALVIHAGVSVAWTAGILAVTVAERTWTCRRAGWRGVLLALMVVPEMGYALFQSWIFFSALRADVLGCEIAWGHVPHGAPVATPVREGAL